VGVVAVPPDPPPPPQAASKAAPSSEIKADLRPGENSMAFSIVGWTPLNSRRKTEGVTIC